MIRSGQIDRGFVQEVLAEPGGEHLLTCWSCGTCAATCLIRRYEPSFNPRVILRKAGLGLRDEVLASKEIWLCSACDACYPRCPKEIHISEVMKAIRNIAVREGYERPGITATVRVATCTACGRCVEACPYEALSLGTTKWNGKYKSAAQVSRNLCMGCGICNSVCPSSSIGVEGYTDAQLYESLVAKAHTLSQISATDLRGEILAIVCNWCLHSEADANTATNPPTGVEVIRVPCAGRVSPLMVMTALQRGADAVLVVGCREGECHYVHGNDLEVRRMMMFAELLETLGVEEGRVRFARLGSLDRGGLARQLNQMAKDVSELRALRR